MNDVCKALVELRELGLNFFYHQLYQEGLEEVVWFCSRVREPAPPRPRSQWDEIIDHLDCVLQNCDDATLDGLLKFFGVYAHRYAGGGRAFFHMLRLVMVDALPGRQSEF